MAINGITNPAIAPGLVNTPITVNSKTTVVVRHPWDGDLSTFDVDIVVTDGTVITGSLYDGQTINIAQNATITLQDVHIEGRLNCLGASTIILKGANEIIAPSGYPAIQAGGYGESATIKGTGSLVAVSDASWLWGYYGISDGLVVTRNDDTYTIAPSAENAAIAAFDAWKAEQNAGGANITGNWNDTDANGVPNAFRYVFDRADAAFTGVVIIGFEADGEGALAIQTLPIVNGKDVFTFTIVASDNADGTGNVMEYPLSVDDPEGITIIEEEYNPHRFFRIRIDVK